MKLAANQVASSIRSSARFVGLLIYGEDWGLVRERSLTAINHVLGTEPNPFQLTTLTREEHGRVRGEAESLALGGGRRVVHVQDGGEALAATLEKLDLRSDDVLLVLEAGELTPRSKLRMFAEKRADWAAIPCYLSSAGQVGAELTRLLSDAGLSATPDALSFLSEELAGESITRRAEMEKLVVFAMGERTIDLDMAKRCCSVSLDTSLGAAVGAALAGRVEACDALLAELAREGATGQGLLAVLSNQVQRLLKVRLLIESGQTAEQACRTLTPPLYPRQAAVFMQDVQRWRGSGLEALGRTIRDADAACKRAASPDMAIAGRLLAAVATVAARQTTQG